MIRGVRELRCDCNLQKTHDLNFHPILCTFLADKFNGHLVFSAYTAHQL